MDSLQIDPEQEVHKITQFLHYTFSTQAIKNVILGLSGGIDSATTLYLLRKALQPKHIFVVQLNYFPKKNPLLTDMLDTLKIPEQNRITISIKPMVDQIITILKIPDSETVRKGNSMARVRMITLFDLAKKHHALICGTENKSEHLLGYFTRFGDGASDIEPIVHLYKTQVFMLAKYLNVPSTIINQAPTAGLWPGQTDEKELGFTYEEADQVLSLFHDKHEFIEEIKAKGFLNAEKILEVSAKNAFKHEVPYKL